MCTHRCTHMYTHTHPPTRPPLKSLTGLPGSFSCQNFRHEIGDQCFSPQHCPYSVPIAQEIRKLSSHMTLSRGTHRVSPLSPVSQPSPAGADEGIVPLHFSHTMALSTKDRPRSDLAKRDGLSAEPCPRHGKSELDQCYCSVVHRPAAAAASPGNQFETQSHGPRHGPAEPSPGALHFSRPTGVSVPA